MSSEGSLYGFVGSSWNDIPDLDPGRNPFPRSRKGRYAIGERKTAIVLYVGVHDPVSEEAMLNSILSVLSSTTNRLYVDILFVQSGSVPPIVEDRRKSLEMEDCLVFTISSNREELLTFLEKNRYEQVLLVQVELLPVDLL